MGSMGGLLQTKIATVYPYKWTIVFDSQFVAVQLLQVVMPSRSTSTINSFNEIICLFRNRWTENMHSYDYGAFIHI